VESKYSIKDLEQLSGIKAHTIRAWEQRYKLIVPMRTVTNIRYYGDHDLRVILNTSVLLGAGWKIGKISKHSPDELALLALDASPYEGNFTYELNELKLATLAFDIKRFEAVMDHCIERYGVHNTYREVIGDYIQELGKLWLSGSVGISQEHFVSSLIRQKIYAAIDALPAIANEKSGRYAIFLPANELHEIGVLYLAYLLKERGEQVFYLGQSLPKEYLTDLLDNQPIDHLISCFTTHPELPELGNYLDELEELIVHKGIQVHLTGYVFTDFEPEREFRNINIYGTLKELSEGLS